MRRTCRTIINAPGPNLSRGSPVFAAALATILSMTANISEVFADDAVEQRVNALLGQMSIEEKIGHKATATQVSAILGLYDPAKAAIRNLKW